jgi:hypothetical protein
MVCIQKSKTSQTVKFYPSKSGNGKERSFREGKAVTRDGAAFNGNTEKYHPVKACLIELEFLSNATALETIKLTNPSGTTIKNTFAENGVIDIFNNIRNQP